jgi:hypothetical protein
LDGKNIKKKVERAGKSCGRGRNNRRRMEEKPDYYRF